VHRSPTFNMRLSTVILSTYLPYGLASVLDTRQHPPFCTSPQNGATCNPLTEDPCCQDQKTLAECVVQQGIEPWWGPFAVWKMSQCTECVWDDQWNCNGAPGGPPAPPPYCTNPQKGVGCNPKDEGPCCQDSTTIAECVPGGAAAIWALVPCTECAWDGLQWNCNLAPV
jgi:hypothetical protein